MQNRFSKCIPLQTTSYAPECISMGAIPRLRSVNGSTVSFIPTLGSQEARQILCACFLLFLLGHFAKGCDTFQWVTLCLPGPIPPKHYILGYHNPWTLAFLVLAVLFHPHISCLLCRSQKQPKPSRVRLHTALTAISRDSSPAHQPVSITELHLPGHYRAKHQIWLPLFPSPHPIRRV